MRRSASVLAAFFIVALTPAFADAQQLTPKEIQDAWVGKTLLGKTAAGAPVTLNLEADGSASVTVGRTYDTGSWRLSDQGYCATWKFIRGGKEGCFTVQRTGAQMTVFNLDGTVQAQITEVK